MVLDSYLGLNLEIQLVLDQVLLHLFDLHVLELKLCGFVHLMLLLTFNQAGVLLKLLDFPKVMKFSLFKSILLGRVGVLN